MQQQNDAHALSHCNSRLQQQEREDLEERLGLAENVVEVGDTDDEADGELEVGRRRRRGRIRLQGIPSSSLQNDTLSVQRRTLSLPL